MPSNSWKLTLASEKSSRFFFSLFSSPLRSAVMSLAEASIVSMSASVSSSSPARKILSAPKRTAAKASSLVSAW